MRRPGLPLIGLGFALIVCALLLGGGSGPPVLAQAGAAQPGKPATAPGRAPALPSDLAARQADSTNFPGDWPLYGRTYSAWRYSPLTQITPQNVNRLQVAWTLETGLHDAFEASPIVVNGVMYFTTPWNHVFAVNAATGEQYWRYVYALPDNLPLCCGAVNRGPAVGGNKVVFSTLDAHVVALDATTGEPVWKTQMADVSQGYSATVAPQVVGDKVILGISGGDFGVRGFVDAYDLESGKRLWRFHTVPGPGEPGHDTWEGDSWRNGGGPAWMTPTYDPETNTVFVGTGNPGPDLNGEVRNGDNLYTECTVALDADTGRIKWYYQTVPHDVWDLDNVVEPILDEITIDGKARKVVMWAGKNGYFYVLDRTNGEFIYAIPFAHKINWGRVLPNGDVELDKSKFPVRDRFTTVYPGAAGGKEWCPVAYDPVRKRLYVPVIENGHMHKVILQKHHPGLLYWGGASVPVPAEAYGHVAAIDVETRKIAWDTRTQFPVVSGITTTATGLVITGTPDRKMLVLDADSGKVLWEFEGKSGFHAAPVVYAVNGKQYIAFANGWGGWVTGFALTGTPLLEGIPHDNTMYVFALPD